jgi:hypothetical protein
MGGKLKGKKMLSRKREIEGSVSSCIRRKTGII